MICVLGTGCIGISISNNSNIESTLLCDISKEALEITKDNIKYNNSSKCVAINTDLFSNVIATNNIDILVSNPPYIKSSVIDTLDNYVKNEPILALDGGSLGLDIYTRILNESVNCLKDGAYILFEIGYDQKDDLINLINNTKYFKYIECIQDLNLKDRVIVCRFHQI